MAWGSYTTAWGSYTTAWGSYPVEFLFPRVSVQYAVFSLLFHGAGT